MSALELHDSARLADLEVVIERGLGTFVEVGQALMEIRDEHLYGTGTFEDYCRTRWNLARSTAYQLVDAAKVVSAMADTASSPTTERQARELVPLLSEPEELKAAWSEAVERHPEGPTAAEVREVVQARKSENTANLKSSETDEWYTPPRYMEVARRFLGVIDLDPASHPVANELVQAIQFFTIADDGLSKEWHGRVWLNPPYGGKCPEFVAKLHQEYAAGRTREALLLVSAYSTETRWFQPLFSYPICFVDHRIKFIDSANQASGSSTIGNAIVYFGARTSALALSFLLADFHYEIENILYPPPRMKGGEMFAEYLIDAMRSTGWVDARDILEGQRELSPRRRAA